MSGSSDIDEQEDHCYFVPKDGSGINAVVYTDKTDAAMACTTIGQADVGSNGLGLTAQNIYPAVVSCPEELAFLKMHLGTEAASISATQSWLGYRQDGTTYYTDDRHTGWAYSTSDTSQEYWPWGRLSFISFGNIMLPNALFLQTFFLSFRHQYIKFQIAISQPCYDTFQQNLMTSTINHVSTFNIILTSI